MQLFICMSTAFSAALAGSEVPATTKAKTTMCPSTVDWGEGFPFDVVVAAFFYYSIYLLVLRRFLVYPLGNLLVYVLAPFELKPKKNSAAAVRKARSVNEFVAGIMQLIDKGFFSYAGASLLLNQAWMWPSQQWWIIPPRLESALAFYLVAVVARRLLEALFAYTDRVDDNVLWTMACNAGAACMVGAALYTGAIRIAFVVIVLNDVALPLLGLAQALSALNKECAADFARVRYALPLLTNVLYGYGAVVFFLARIAAMTYVVASASTEADALVARFSSAAAAKPQWWLQPGCVLAVWLLYAGQWFEFTRLLRSVVARILHGAPTVEDATAHVKSK